MLALLQEVADELPVEDEQRTLVVVGGALLAWHGLRDATRDVDSVVPIDAVLARAVALVAARHGLAPRWVNDAALPFLPRGFDTERGVVIWSDRRLRVVGAPLNQVFLMKVFAGRATDVPDLRSLWPHTGFSSPARAATAFFAAYPVEEHDPFLEAWIAQQVE